ncbi:hypothetical protein WUBG_00692 [Wuchereria bancrofti]|uniref:Uncharacterized protein n=1 Tax=Wuchereria bancrofti TaxID=6293 RepID=J9FFI0_WUCBA|nr:hypothetical protein WUBG_00692 [Wuchereria bancrofti]
MRVHLYNACALYACAGICVYGECAELEAAFLFPVSFAESFVIEGLCYSLLDSDDTLYVSTNVLMAGPERPAVLKRYFSKHFFEVIIVQCAYVCISKARTVVDDADRGAVLYWWTGPDMSDVCTAGEIDLKK